MRPPNNEMPAPKYGAGTALALILAFGVTFGLPNKTFAGLLNAQDKRMISTGREIYKQHCASCHGANLEGEPNWKSPKPSGRMPAPPHSEKGHTWHHADKLLFDLTKFGLKKFGGENYASDMPAYREVLSDFEIIAALSYIKSSWPPEIQEYHDHLNEKASKAQE